jgi:putative molybdopterin biosynthesis protein
MTHSEVAAAVAEGGADAGLGLEASARMYGLDFIPLTRERYDLVVPAPGLEMPALQALTRWLEAETSRQEIARLDGYDFGEMGNLRWVE